MSLQALKSLLRVPSALPASFRPVSGVLWQLQHHISLATAVQHFERNGSALLLLHPASQPHHSLEEAVRLAESLSGGRVYSCDPGSTCRRSFPSPWQPHQPARLAAAAAVLLTQEARRRSMQSSALPAGLAPHQPLSLAAGRWSRCRRGWRPPSRTGLPPFRDATTR